MTTKYTLYDTQFSRFWYNMNDGGSSWTESLSFAQPIDTIGKAFVVCCELYDKDMYNMGTFILIELIDDEPNFGNPIWIGDIDKMLLLWGEIPKSEKVKTLEALFNQGMPKMYKIAKGWYDRGL